MLKKFPNGLSTRPSPQPPSYRRLSGTHTHTHYVSYCMCDVFDLIGWLYTLLATRCALVCLFLFIFLSFFFFFFSCCCRSIGKENRLFASGSSSSSSTFLNRKRISSFFHLFTTLLCMLYCMLKERKSLFFSLLLLVTIDSQFLADCRRPSLLCYRVTSRPVSD